MNKIKNQLHKEDEERMAVISEEFLRTFELIQNIPRSVTFFGSSKSKEGELDYERARNLAKKISALGFAIVTGGGPGIMEAANRGAKEAGGISVGFNIELPNKQAVNPYVTKSIGYHYLFSRKVALAFSAEAFIFFPGGFGTLDEFFEIVTLIQTKKIQRVPVFLVDSSFWRPLEDLLRKVVYEKYQAIDDKDLEIFSITDDEEEILKIVKNTPQRDE